VLGGVSTPAQMKHSPTERPIISNYGRWREVVRQQWRGPGGPAGGVEVRGLRQGQYWRLAAGRQRGARTCRDRCERRRTSGRGGRSSRWSCGSSGAAVRHSRSVRFPVRQSSCPLSRAGARVGGHIRGGRSGSFDGQSLCAALALKGGALVLPQAMAESGGELPFDRRQYLSVSVPTSNRPWLIAA